MEIVGLIIGIIAYAVGYNQGSRNTAKKIFKALGVKPGYEIAGVSFRKKG